MSAKNAADSGAGTNTVYCLISDGSIRGVYSTKTRARAQQLRYNTRRRAQIAARAPSRIGREYVAYSRAGVARLDRHTASTAQAEVGYGIPTLSVIALSIDADLDVETLLPDLPVEPVEQPLEEHTAACPNCGALIGYDPVAYGGNYLTWCEACDWHGFVQDHLLANDKKGAQLWKSG